MIFSPTVKARIRLAVVTIALVPVALLAQLVLSEKLTEAVQRRWAKAWQKYDTGHG